MTTESTTKQWPLLTSFLAARGTPNGVELFEAARNGGVETETESGLSVVVPDDDMTIGNIRAFFLLEAGESNEEDKYYGITGQEAEDASWWQYTFGEHRIESDGFSREKLEAWETKVRTELDEVNFVDPRDKAKAFEILDAVVAALDNLLDEDDSSDGTDDDDTGCGD